MTKDGQTLDVCFTVTPLRDSQGNITAFAMFERDIKERSKTPNLGLLTDM